MAAARPDPRRKSRRLAPCGGGPAFGLGSFSGIERVSLVSFQPPPASDAARSACVPERKR